MSDAPKTTRRRTTLPSTLSAPTKAEEEESAPVEAVRAVAALLGRAALPRSSARPPLRSAERDDAEDERDSTPRGDRDVPIAGNVATLSDEADDAVRDAQKRHRRAVRHVEEVLERLSSEAPDDLST